MAEKTLTKANYPKDAVALVKAGLLFVAVKLGDFLDEVVVVGGVVPSLLVDQENAAEAHAGTTDLDLALSLSVLDDEKYVEFAKRLRDAGFRAVAKEEGGVKRQTWGLDGKLGRITIDFLIPRSDKANPKRLLQDFERDFAAVRTRGLELAFVDRRQITLNGMTIEGDRATRVVSVAGLAAMVILKAFAFDNRGAEKDAYDMFYLIRESGADRVSEVLSTYRADESFQNDCRDAIEIIKRDFSHLDGVGVGSVIRFLQEEGNDDMRADVLGQFAAVVRHLDP